MHSLSRTTWSRKGVVMVLDTAKPKNRKSTILPGMRGGDAARKLTLKVDISQVFTIDFSEIQFIVNHISQSDGQKKSAKRWTNLQKKSTRITSLQRNFQKYKGPWYVTLYKSGENGLMRLRPDFRAAVSLKNRIHRESGEPISTQQYRRWHPSLSTSWWDKSEWDWKWAHKNSFKWLFCYSWFRLQSIAIHCNRRGV